MNFDLTDEQQMIVESFVKFVATDSPVSRFRETREEQFDAPLDQEADKNMRQAHARGQAAVRTY